MSQVARLLKIRKQTVHGHAKALEEAQAIIRAPGCKSPVLFVRGPRADSFEHLSRGQVQHHGGWSGPDHRCRIHRGGYKWAVSRGPVVTPPWERSWSASGVEFGELTIPGEAFDVKVREVRGKRSVSLLLDPGEEFVFNAEDVENAAQRRMAAVARVGRAFAAEFGYLLVGAMREVQPVEFAFDAPGFQRVGVPGESAVWVDESPGSPEIETQMAGVAAGLLRLPMWMERTDERLETIEGVLVGHTKILDRVVSVQERMVLTQQQMIEAVVGLQEHAAARGPDGPEVA